LTVTGEVNTGAPAHVSLLGPNSVKVMVPVGVTPPLSVAVSEIAPPNATLGDAVVLIAGVAWAIVDVSFGALHAPVTAALLASPLYAAIHRYVPAAVGVNGPDA
jgi:hypothetical protein